VSPGTDTSRRTKVVVSFAIIYLVWGSTYLVTKIGVGHLPPFTFGAARFVSGGLLLFLVARLVARRSGAPLLPVVSPTEWRHLACVGFLSVFASNGTGVWSLQYVPSNLAALLNVSASFWIPLLGMFGARSQSLGTRVASGLAIGFAGTALVAWPGNDAAAALAWPTLIVLAGCFSWSLGTIYQRSVSTSLDLMTFTALQMLCGGLMLALVMWLAGEPQRWHVDAAGLAALAYMTILSSCIGYTAYAWLSVNVAPAQLATYGFVNPAIALLLGWWVLGESLTTLKIIGTVIILGGTLLVNWPRRTPARNVTVEDALNSVKRGAPPSA
jgi:drug/metabolite transporter (DMT)-like permease